MEQKIKICYVASVDITVKFILLNHLKFLKKQGYDVFAVCSPGKWMADIEKNGINVKAIQFKRKIFSPVYDLVALVELFFYFKKEKFDIVHTHTPKAGFLGQLAAKMAGIPIIANTIHGFYFTENTPFLKRKFYILIEKIAAKCSDVIFSISKKIIRQYVAIGIGNPDAIKYLGDGIDVLRFDPSKFTDDFIAQKKSCLNINPQKKIIGIVARLVEEKGYLELFAAFKIVLGKFPDALLLVIGQEEPEKKDNIKKDIIKKYGIENNVIFMGERTDTEELYSIMDIFVLPSHREGLGLATLEASAMEKPVIVTDTGGCPETVENGKTGILIPIKNHLKLAETIMYLFSHPEKAKEMGKRGREKILREFDEKIIFKRINTEYQKLINNKLK